jgi:hypothetical protein
VLPYYDNARFLKRQLEHLDALPAAVRQCLGLVVVDDCSPAKPAIEVMQAHYHWRELNTLRYVRLFRIERDVRWNWIAARNIGAHHAPVDDWLLMTDMDHMLPPGTAEMLIHGVLEPAHIYRFERREHTGHAIHPHPNSWFLTRSMYWKIGGHDEALSGYYGTDGEYRRRCVKTAPIFIMNAALERHEFIEDSSTTKYKRKQPEDAAVKRMIAARHPRLWKPKTLSFPYHEVTL